MNSMRALSGRGRVLIAVGLIAILAAAAALLYRSGPSQAPSPARAEKGPVVTASAAVDRSLLVRFHSPYWGSGDAKVEIVEFFDPACEGCAAFYPYVKRVLEEHSGRIRLWVRYAPFHRGADQVVRLLEASRRQGKYAETFEALVRTQSDWAINHAARLDLALRAAEGLGMDMERLKKDMEAPEIGRLIEQDIQDAKTLKIRGTPEFFINGELLDPLGFDQFRDKVSQAVRAAYPK